MLDRALCPAEVATIQKSTKKFMENTRKQLDAAEITYGAAYAALTELTSASRDVIREDILGPGVALCVLIAS